MLADEHGLVIASRALRVYLDALREGRPPVAGIDDNLAALEVVEAAYRGARTKQVVELL